MPVTGGDITHLKTFVNTVAHLESIEIANFSTGDEALLRPTGRYYTLDKESLLPADGATVVLAKGTRNGALPGRWILTINFLGGATGGTGIGGATGPAGPAGATGATGPAGSALAFANFFAIMPPDNAATVAVGGDLDFPQDGPASVGSGITRIGVDSFAIANPGVYEVEWQASITEPGQLGLSLNGVMLPATIVGRATGTSQIVGSTIITVATPASVLTVRNPPGNATALTVTPIAGGASGVSATLSIKRLS